MYLKYLLFFSIIVWYYSCKDSEHEKIIFNSSDGSYSEEYFVVKDSIKDGLYKRYFENGKLEISCDYKMGVIEGIKKRYSEKGYLEALETYKNGKMDGTYIVYHPDGSVKLKQIFIDDLLQGLSISYFQNGKMKEKVTIKDGFENGVFEEYYPSGVLHWKGNYLNGENEHDTLLEYNQSGQLRRKLFCQMGFCKTIWKSDKLDSSIDSVKNR